jgi:hypothetical protein
MLSRIPGTGSMGRGPLGVTKLYTLLFGSVRQKPPRHAIQIAVDIKFQEVEQRLGSVETGEVAHARFYPVLRRVGIL